MSDKQRIKDLKVTRKALARSLTRLRQKGYFEMGEAEEFLLGEVSRDLKAAGLEERLKQQRGKKS